MRRYGTGDMTEEVYRNEISRYGNVGEFIKNRPDLAPAFVKCFEDWINSDVSLVIEERSGKKAGPAEIFIHVGNRAYTDGKKEIYIPVSYTFPLMTGASVHERLHFYPEVNESALSYHEEKIRESKTILENGGKIGREYILHFFKTLTGKHFDSLVGHIISELIAYTETGPVLNEAKVPFGIDPKPYFDMWEKNLKNEKNTFERYEERELLITPESFYNELIKWYQYYSFARRPNDVMKGNIIPLVSTQFSHYAKIVNGFDEMPPSELWSLEPEKFVEEYNRKVRKLKSGK
ncbi:MAG: hypothetical protein JW754_02820 [Candidatus Aenigmarchaeota archaeon]|nr:hypothetical protein [Candidatus Aenigmarchaeota archaeon]